LFYHVIGRNSTRQKHWTYLWATWRVSCQKSLQKRLRIIHEHLSSLTTCFGVISAVFLLFLSPFCVSCIMLVFGLSIHGCLFDFLWYMSQNKWLNYLYKQFSREMHDTFRGHIIWYPSHQSLKTFFKFFNQEWLDEWV
jgi:hypothetical protein